MFNLLTTKEMRKLIFAAVLVMVSMFVFVSCGTQDDPNPLEETEEGGGVGEDDPIIQD